MILNALDSVVSEYLLAEGRKVHTLFVFTQFVVTIIHPHGCSLGTVIPKEGANKQVISSQADSLIKISRIWADFFPANTSNQPI